MSGRAEFHSPAKSSTGNRVNGKGLNAHTKKKSYIEKKTTHKPFYSTLIHGKWKVLKGDLLIKK